MQVVAQASTQSGGNWQWKRAYLEGYFFDEFLGLGLPKLIASASAFNASGQLQQLTTVVPKAASLLASTVTASTLSSGGSTVDLSSLHMAGGPASHSGGSDIGPSASMVGGGGPDPSQLASLVSSVVKEVMSPLSARLEALEGTRRGAAEGARELAPVVPGRKCLFCGRESCEFIRGGDPCREAKQAETARNQANAAKRRAAEAASAA